MALVDLVMPKLGEAIMEATVLKWLKNIGDHVQEEEPVLEIATDKVDSEVPSSVSGVLKEILYEENDVIRIGEVIARIETAVQENPGNDPLENALKQNTSIAKAEDAVDEEHVQAVPYVPANTDTTRPAALEGTGANNGFYSPLVLNIARKEGIRLSELEKIEGTGNEGRLTKNDLLNYLADRKGSVAAPLVENKAPEVSSEPPQMSTPPVTAGTKSSGNTEIIEMDRMRKMIAHHMKESQNISATVTSFAEADVTAMVNWRNKIKDDFEKREGTKITFTPMFIECVARVLRRYPMINSSVEGDKIIVKKDLNIGMATALPNGNLIVPVIKNADNLNLVGLAKQVNALGGKARKNKLSPDDTQRGTFTITNVGSFGSLTGTPIINQPEVAILAVGTIKKRPVVIETPEGDVIGIRHMMIVSMSYDHRIIDGAMGSMFLAEVVKEFESWDVNRVA